jgi:hypothetical protein
MSSKHSRVRRNMSFMWVAAAVALFLVARTMPSLSAPEDAGMSAGAVDSTIVASAEVADVDSGDDR